MTETALATAIHPLWSPLEEYGQSTGEKNQNKGHESGRRRKVGDCERKQQPGAEENHGHPERDPLAACHGDGNF
jgi:hypothetical protein